MSKNIFNVLHQDPSDDEDERRVNKRGGVKKADSSNTTKSTVNTYDRTKAPLGSSSQVPEKKKDNTKRDHKERSMKNDKKHPQGDRNSGTGRQEKKTKTKDLIEGENVQVENSDNDENAESTEQTSSIVTAEEYFKNKGKDSIAAQKPINKDINKDAIHKDLALLGQKEAWDDEEKFTSKKQKAKINYNVTMTGEDAEYLGIKTGFKAEKERAPKEDKKEAPKEEQTEQAQEQNNEEQNENNEKKEGGRRNRGDRGDREERGNNRGDREERGNNRGGDRRRNDNRGQKGGHKGGQKKAQYRADENDFPTLG